MIKSSLKKTEENLSDSFNHKLAQVKDLILEQKARSSVQNKETKKAITAVTQMQTTAMAKLEQILDA